MPGLFWYYGITRRRKSFVLRVITYVIVTIYYRRHKMRREIYPYSHTLASKLWKSIEITTKSQVY